MGVQKLFVLPKSKAGKMFVICMALKNKNRHSTHKASWYLALLNFLSKFLLDLDSYLNRLSFLSSLGGLSRF